MGIRIECLAKALKINTDISESDEKRANVLMETYYYTSRNLAYQEVLAEKVLKKIYELV